MNIFNNLTIITAPLALFAPIILPSNHDRHRRHPIKTAFQCATKPLLTFPDLLRCESVRVVANCQFCVPLAPLPGTD